LYYWQKSVTHIQLQHSQTVCSIIIAARNEEQTITQTISDLLRQTYPHKNIQIIIGNDHSTDNTYSIVQTFAQNNSNIHIYSMPDYIEGKKQTIQYILQYATGEYILFTDADCSIPPTWVETYMAYAQKFKGHFYFGNVSHDSPHTLLQSFFTLDFLAIVGVQGGLALAKRAFSCNAANMCISRELYTSYYNTNTRYSSGDDVFLLHAAKQIYPNDIYFIKHNAATITTKAPKSASEFIQQRIRWSSKATGYKDTDAICVSIIVFAMSFTICCTTLFTLIWSQFLPTLLILLLSKTLIDSIFFYKVLQHFNTIKLIWLVPIFEPLYVFYITFIPIFAILIPIQWKQRTIQ